MLPTNVMTVSEGDLLLEVITEGLSFVREKNLLSEVPSPLHLDDAKRLIDRVYPVLVEHSEDLRGLREVAKAGLLFYIVKHLLSKNSAKSDEEALIPLDTVALLSEKFFPGVSEELGFRIVEEGEPS